MIIPCPSCGGSGTRADGSLLISRERCVLTPASRCATCAGQKAVVLRPATDEEAKLCFAAAFIIDTRLGGE